MSEQFEEIDVEAVKKEMAELLENQKLTDEKLTIYRDQAAEIEKQFQAISRLRRDMEHEASKIRASIRDKEKALAQAQRLQLVKEEQARLAEEMLKRGKELDELTASAKWREFAFDHQISGGKTMAIAKRGIVADKRGLGKTLTGLIYLDMVQAKKVLVVAPNDVVPQFEEEIRHWAPARTIISLRGLPKSQRDIMYPLVKMMNQVIVTINYEAWRRDKSIIDDLIESGLDTVICDEAHRAKSSNKVTARGIFQVAYRPNFCPSCSEVKNFCGPWQNEKGRLEDKFVGGGWSAITCATCGSELETTVKNVLSMTGTPFLNKPQELFSLLYLVDRNKFPSERRFLQDYCWSVGPNKWKFRPGGLDRLTKFMSQFFIQRNREDAGITIPPPDVKIYEVEKDFVRYAKQYEAERTITEKAALLLEDGTRKDIFFILEMILRERQAMTWPAGIVITDPETKEPICNFDVYESQKLDEAMDLLTDLMEEEERVIVFSQFKAPLYEMHSRNAKAGYSGVMATGDQSGYQKEQVRMDFDLKTAPEEPRWNACFATYKAFGTGVNLNAARHIIMLDDEWSPGNEDQAIGRIDRLNSTDQANVHIFRVKNSIDDWMAALLDFKKGLTDEFNDSTDMAGKLMEFFKRDN